MSSTDPEAPTSPLASGDGGRRGLVGATMRGGGGREALERYSGQVDAVLQLVFTDCPKPSQQVAVVALGGYGRRQLCLYSDIDILVLFERGIGAEEERF